MTNPMCREGTPVEHYPDLGLYVKREDLSCDAPPFSKTRGVFAHVKARPERVIGVLDTYHSQGGWAVARACKLLHKTCVNYYPIRKAEVSLKAGVPSWGLKPQQLAAADLGAKLIHLQAGRSAVLYHQAKKHLTSMEYLGGTTYMMPNALKLPEMITETVAEVYRTQLPDVNTVIVSASSGTIAAGLWKGLRTMPGWRTRPPRHLIVHQGYDRPEGAMRKYMTQMAGYDVQEDIEFVNEGYSYGDTAKPGPNPPFPCNEFYDLKAFRWWVREGRAKYGEALLWNIG